MGFQCFADNYKAPLFCAGVTAYHGVEDAGCEPGDWMAIIGYDHLHPLQAQELTVMIDVVDWAIS